MTRSVTELANNENYQTSLAQVLADVDVLVEVGEAVGEVK
jgi:hypothetical protein